MVYLLHFSLPYWHAQHYVGFTHDLRGRIQYHLRGDGSRLLAAVAKTGRRVVVARKWKGGDRGLERRLKQRHGGIVEACPICSGRRAYRFARAA